MGDICFQKGIAYNTPCTVPKVAMNANTFSGLSRSHSLFRRFRHLAMFLIVSFAFPCFLSSHKTLNILSFDGIRL